MGLEFGNPAADCRKRDAELAARGGQTAGLRRRRPEGTWLRGDPHILPFFGIIYSQNSRLLDRRERTMCRGPSSNGGKGWATAFSTSRPRLPSAPRRKRTAVANSGRISEATASPTASPKRRRRSSPSATASTWRRCPRAAGPMSSIAAARPASSAFSTTGRWRFADFRGNRQYISTGNLASNDRAALILMDYPNRAPPQDLRACRGEGSGCRSGVGREI